MGDAYRDADRTQLATFTQHVSIAVTMTAEYQRLMGAAPGTVATSSDEPLEEFKRQVGFVWEGGWDQLAQARAIAAALGRDVTGHDAARAHAGDLYIGIVDFKVTGTRRRGRSYDRVLAWAFRSPEPMQAAIAAIRAAVPEVVVPEPRPDEPVVDLSPAPRWPWVAVAAVIAGAVYYFVH